MSVWWLVNVISTYCLNLHHRKDIWSIVWTLVSVIGIPEVYLQMQVTPMNSCNHNQLMASHERRSTYRTYTQPMYSCILGRGYNCNLVKTFLFWQKFSFLSPNLLYWFGMMSGNWDRSCVFIICVLLVGLFHNISYVTTTLYIIWLKTIAFDWKRVAEK